MSVVSSDRRDVIFGLESTLWKSCLSFVRGSALSDTESSQSDPSSSSSSSSSSMALSGASPSSSDSKTSSSSCDLWWLIVRDSTSSLNEVCFLLLRGSFKPAVNELCLVGWHDICSSNELSSSPDEPPRTNMPPIFDPSAFE